MYARANNGAEVVLAQAAYIEQLKKEHEERGAAGQGRFANRGGTFPPSPRGCSCVIVIACGCRCTRHDAPIVQRG